MERANGEWEHLFGLLKAANQALQAEVAELRNKLAAEQAHYKDAAGQALDLVEQNRVLFEALSMSRGQWIHSVNAKRCLEALAQAASTESLGRPAGEIKVPHPEVQHFLNTVGDKECRNKENV